MGTNPFKVGDKVKVVDGVGKRLKKGSIHTVTGSDEYYVRIDGGEFNGWFHRRFIHTTNTPRAVPPPLDQSNTEDVVNRPTHYTQFVIEPITFIMRNDLPFFAGNIIKYVCRAGKKKYEGKSAADSEIIDLKKVIRYAEMRINQIENKDEL